MDDITSQRLEILRQEASDFFQAGQEAARRSDTFLGTAITLITAGTILGGIATKPILFLVLPGAALLLGSMVLISTGDVIAMGMYRKALERCINDILKVDTLLWEEKFVSIRLRGRTTPTLPLLQLILAAATTGLIIYGALVAQDFPLWAQYTYYAGTIMAALLSFVAYLDGRRIRREATVERERCFPATANPAG